VVIYLFSFLQRRQEELERKAQELARREEEFKNAPFNGKVFSMEECCFVLKCMVVSYV
jgi:hypothetical protein